MKRRRHLLSGRESLVGLLFVFFLLEFFVSGSNRISGHLAGPAHPDSSVSAPVVFHADPLVWQDHRPPAFPPADSVRNFLIREWTEHGKGYDIGLDLEVQPYWASGRNRPRRFGWSFDIRAVDPATGQVLAASSNEEHESGPGSLWRWAVHQAGPVLEWARDSLSVASFRRAGLPRVAVNWRHWNCTWGDRFARAAAERVTDELLWAGRVVPVVGSQAGPADYELTGRVDESRKPDNLRYLDILAVNLLSRADGDTLLRKTFVAEPGLKSRSPQIEAPLANARTAARVIAQFFSRRGRHAPRPEIVSRKDWGARAPKPGIESCRYPGDPGEYLNWIVVHHTAYDPSGPNEVQDEHMLPRGTGPGRHPFGRNWLDVGYHFMIARNGTIYEGRRLCYVGAHAGGPVYGRRDRRLPADFGAIGIVLFGDFRFEQPTAQQKRSLCKLLAYLSDRYTILPDHVVTHREMWYLTKSKRPLGGPTTPATECPGENLRKFVETWRSRHER